MESAHTWPRGILVFLYTRAFGRGWAPLPPLPAAPPYIAGTSLAAPRPMRRRNYLLRPYARRRLRSPIGCGGFEASFLVSRLAAGLPAVAVAASALSCLSAPYIDRCSE